MISLICCLVPRYFPTRILGYITGDSGETGLPPEAHTRAHIRATICFPVSVATKLPAATIECTIPSKVPDRLIRPETEDTICSSIHTDLYGHVSSHDG